MAWLVEPPHTCRVVDARVTGQGNKPVFSRANANLGASAAAQIALAPTLPDLIFVCPFAAGTTVE
jgi:hypothetical protein